MVRTYYGYDGTFNYRTNVLPAYSECFWTPFGGRLSHLNLIVSSSLTSSLHLYECLNNLIYTMHYLTQSHKLTD